MGSNGLRCGASPPRYREPVSTLAGSNASSIVARAGIIREHVSVAINAWWAGDPSERFWMETTGRLDPGVDLHAPQLNGAGKPEWGYALVAETTPGDVVLHWHKSLRGRPALVGWSTVTGPLSVDEDYSWMPQGTRGRARGVPTVGYGWRMPCGGMNSFDRPIDGARLAACESEMRAILQDLQRQVHGAIYFPFTFYRPGQVRSSQSYLTKFPRQLLDVFPELVDVALRAKPPEVSEPTAAAQPRSGSAGRLQDVRRRIAIEQHAVRMAAAHYRDLGATDVEELGKPYDLLVRGCGPVRHVEVKGSTAPILSAVELTVNEVVHAAEHQPTDLVVVDGIVLDSDATSGEPATAGGRLRIWPDWRPAPDALNPTRFAYTLPPQA